MISFLHASVRRCRNTSVAAAAGASPTSSPEARGAEVGHRLVETAPRRLRDRGVGSVELQVLAGNTDAVRFWSSLGWVLELDQTRLDLSGRDERG